MDFEHEVFYTSLRRREEERRVAVAQRRLRVVGLAVGAVVFALAVFAAVFIIGVFNAGG